MSSIVLNPSGQPASPVEGEVYYDSTADKLKVRDASAFREVVTQDATFNGTIGSSATSSANLPAVKTALNASGSAPIYACRAFVLFDGSSSGGAGSSKSVRISQNVSAVTDVAQGHYKVTFDTAMNNANICAVASCGSSVYHSIVTNYANQSQNYTEVRLFGFDTNAADDDSWISVAVFN